jgi:acetyl esterase/lipase
MCGVWEKKIFTNGNYPVTVFLGQDCFFSKEDYVRKVFNLCDMIFKSAVSFLILVCLLPSLNVNAQNNLKYTDIDLWPHGMPNTNGRDKSPFNEAEGNYKPTVRIYLDRTKATGRAVIICPGGGYTKLAYDHEGYDFAPFFLEQGIAVIVLKYRMPLGHREVPYSDAEEAIRLVKENAKEWNINVNDIGIMGSSAGGHLASTIATHAKAESRPAFQILLYPVITMDSTYTHKGSRKNLIGTSPSAELVNLYSNERQVTSETPRAFIVFSDDDKGVSPINGVNYYAALKQNNVPASLHIYPSGGHGWGYRDNFKYKKLFLKELREWLKSF